jgi:hypothetical protein
VIRVILCGIFLSILVAACLYIKHTAFDFVHARLLDQESKTSAWLLKQVGFALPWIVICIFHGMVYCKHDRRDGIAQREMFWEVLIVTALTYLVLLPYLHDVSDAMYAAALEAGADIPRTDGKVDKTLIMIFHEWFIRLTVPLGALAVYHGSRARRERLHPETEAVEPLMTKAEYDAKKRAAAGPTETETADETRDETINETAPIEAETALTSPEVAELPSSPEGDTESAPAEPVPTAHKEVPRHE